MKYLFVLSLIFYCFANVSARKPCKIITNKLANTVSLHCTELKTLQKYLDAAPANTTNIVITDSVLSNIPGHAFARFGATLKVLDLHENGIEVLEAQAFIGLTNLNKLILWGNRLKWIQSEWFVNLQRLQTLDLSFNQIQNIDYNVFPALSSVQNFYIDYNELRSINFNMFAYMVNLKKIRFGKNPWDWGYRALLTWQMENQNVDYSSEWDDWNWMSNVIKDCTESGEGEIPSDTVIDCAVRKLLDFTYDTLHFSPIGWANGVGCAPQARRLINCARPINATGNTEYQTIRIILQDFSRILPPMEQVHSLFSYGSHPEL
ncbi:hypothetical protein KPH14_004900 [Odynerus spinipes]|uniref:Uncharacterized protein n=1 Tax=Odynerus spinipes TaxID=1348599 RepID=A0AAD9RN23_9HYME|nr:hypothetical protein KPH14_004900 [Odynerus spinipes]